VPTIRALRARFSEVAQAEAERTLGKLGGLGDKERREVQMLADSIVNKLLHAPLTALKREAESESLVAAVHALFELRATETPPPIEKPAGDEPRPARAAILSLPKGDGSGR